MDFDYKQLLVTTGEDENLAGELISVFLKVNESMLEEIAKAVQDGQTEELHHAAHKLKGSLISLGAGTALDIVVALETMAINEELSEAGAALEKLRTAMNLLVIEMQNHGARSLG